MSSYCNIQTIQQEFLQETGIPFRDWRNILLAVPHANQGIAINYMMSRGLSKKKAEFLVHFSISDLVFIETK